MVLFDIDPHALKKLPVIFLELRKVIPEQNLTILIILVRHLFLILVGVIFSENGLLQFPKQPATILILVLSFT